MTYRCSVKYNPKIEQKPFRHSFCQTLRLNFHWKCFISTLLIYVCILYSIWCYLNYYGIQILNLPPKILTYSNELCAYRYNFIPIAFAILLYIIYMAECWNNWRKLKILPKKSSTEVYDLVQKMRAAIPIVWWKSVCYHYIRRTKQVTRYRNGDAITATQVYYERVNSHSSGNVFLYDSSGFKDISKDLLDLERYPLIRMQFTKGFVFACVQAANEFDEQRTRFFNENEVKDDYMEVREGLDLAEVPFIEQILVYRSSNQNCTLNINNNNEDEENFDSTKNSKINLIESWYMRSTVYWLASLLLLNWPLRIFIECRIAHLPYQITKLFGTNYLSPSSVNYTGLLTRTSTMESRELELANRENYIIIPSYNEAILLDPLMTSNVPSQISIELSNGQNQVSSSIRNEFCERNEPFFATNEALIFTNYGSINNSLVQPYNRLNNETKHNYESINNDSYLKSNNLFYNQQFQRFVNSVKAGDFSPFKRQKINKQQKPLQSSRSMSFFSGDDYLNNPELLIKTVKISRPSDFKDFNRGKKLNIKNNQLNCARSSNYNQNKQIPNWNKKNTKKKFPTRSITISDNGFSTFENLRSYPRIEQDIEQESLIVSNLQREQDSFLLNEQHNNSIGIDEPPPPYEIALRMCAPIYERLRRSANSISSLLNILSINQNGNDLQQYSLDRSSSNRNDACSSNYKSYNHSEYRSIT